MLRWSERYTKTDMVHLTKGGFWLLFGYVSQTVTGLILMIAFTNLTSKDTYGTYQFIMAGAGIITGFTLSGMGTAISRAVAKGSDGALPYGFQKQFLWNIGVIIAGTITGAYYFIVGKPDLGIAFLMVGVFEALLSGLSLYKPFLVGKELFKENVTIGIWRKSIPIVVILIALLLTDDPIVLVLAYYVSSTISTGLMYLLVRRQYPAPPVPDPELLSLSKHLSVVGLATRVTANIDKMLIFYFLGPVQVAVYTLALFPVTHFENLFALVGQLVLPRFVRQNLPAIKEGLLRKIGLFFFVIVLLVLAYILIAKYIFGLFFPAYPEAILLTQVAILSMLLKPRLLFEQAFTAHNMKRSLYIYRISSAVIKIVLLVFLIPIYGLWGAVWAFLATHVYSTILSGVLFYTNKK